MWLEPFEGVPIDALIQCSAEAMSIRRSAHCAWLLTAALCLACGTRETTVEFYRSGDYRFSGPERRTIEDIAEDTAIEARAALPSLPPELLIRVYAGADVIPETGETATAVPPATVILVIDPARPGGVQAVVRVWLRAALLHEFHHLVRSQEIRSTTLIDWAIAEGMATAFERDVADVSPPWGAYAGDAAAWVEELMALPSDADRGYWLTAPHADGRRWIGMRAGTYLVDRAMLAS